MPASMGALAFRQPGHQQRPNCTTCHVDYAAVPTVTISGRIGDCGSTNLYTLPSWGIAQTAPDHHWQSDQRGVLTSWPADTQAPLGEFTHSAWAFSGNQLAFEFT
ncbi:MAG: hypothetical protein R2911_00030 [Caldilineaceae bacterium]